MSSEDTLPTAPGFYWAQWKIAGKGTEDYDEFLPSDKWEVVEVFDNLGDDPDYPDPDSLRVFVLGVTATQSLENFVWGAIITPPISPQSAFLTGTDVTWKNPK